MAKGRLITIDNYYYEIFNGILNPKQLEGLRLFVTQFPQQQFNATEDRRTANQRKNPLEANMRAILNSDS